MGDFSDEEFAPLCVPVALWPAGSRDPKTARYIRLATGIQAGGLRLRSPLPEDLRGVPLSTRLQLPAPLPFMPDGASASDAGTTDDDAGPWNGDLSLVSVPQEVVLRDGHGERAELRRLAFVRLPKAQRARLDRSVTLRLLSDE